MQTVHKLVSRRIYVTRLLPLCIVAASIVAMSLRAWAGYGDDFSVTSTVTTSPSDSIEVGDDLSITITGYPHNAPSALYEQTEGHKWTLSLSFSIKSSVDGQYVTAIEGTDYEWVTPLSPLTSGHPESVTQDNASATATIRPLKPGYWKIAGTATGTYWSSADGDENDAGNNVVSRSGSNSATVKAHNVTYDPGDKLKVTYWAPDGLGHNIGVSPGERIIFDVEFVDYDKKKTNPDGSWKRFLNVDGPYEMDWSCSNDASFDSVGSGKRTKTTHGLFSGNVYVYPSKTWTGNPNITVTCVIKDKAPNPAAAPDTGTAQDQSLTLTWTFVKRATPPTTIKTIQGPNGVWRASVASYTYQAGPNNPPAYAWQSVLESFDPAKAGGLFAMTDLTASWRNAHPTYTTADQVAALLFSTGRNGTFVLDNNDEMTDKNGGFGPTNEFTAAALANGVGFEKTQHFSAGGNVLGDYTIDFKDKSGAVTVYKTGP